MHILRLLDLYIISSAIILSFALGTTNQEAPKTSSIATPTRTTTQITPPPRAPLLAANDDPFILSISGTENPAIYKCYQSHIDFEVAIRSMHSHSQWTWHTITHTRGMRVDILNTSVSTTTDCFGVTRALGKATYLEVVSFAGATYLNSERAYSIKSPLCTIIDTDCTAAQRIKTSIEQYISSWDTKEWMKTIPGPSNYLQYRFPAPCTLPSPSCPTKSTSISCLVGANAAATVFFWPVTITKDENCLSLTTVSATQTKPGSPNTAVLNGLTLTSPSALVIFSSLYKQVYTVSSATSLFYQYCGHSIGDATITVHPSRLSSIRYGFSEGLNPSETRKTPDKNPPGTPVAHPINWADLNPFGISPDAYFSGRVCRWGSCGSVIRDDYEWMISMPNEVSGVDENYKTCQGKMEIHAHGVPITTDSIERKKTFAVIQSSIMGSLRQVSTINADDVTISTSTLAPPTTRVACGLDVPGCAIVNF